MKSPVNSDTTPDLFETTRDIRKRGSPFLEASTRVLAKGQAKTNLLAGHQSRSIDGLDDSLCHSEGKRTI